MRVTSKLRTKPFPSIPVCAAAVLILMASGCGKKPASNPNELHLLLNRHPFTESIMRFFPEFEKQTGCAVIVNTSFNVRGEPIICTPQDAYRCFMRTEMDTLVIEDFILYKEEQPSWEEGEAWRDELELD